MAEIINLSGNSSDDPLPIEIADIISSIQAVPNEIAEGYIEGIELCMEHALRWKEIMSAKDRPLTLRHLIGKLDVDQLEKLRQISLYMLSRDPLEKLKQLRENTFNTIEPDEESLEKAEMLVKEVVSLEVDFDTESKELTSRAKQIQMLADLFALAHLGKQFVPIMTNLLATCSKIDLEALIEFCKLFNIKTM